MTLKRDAAHDSIKRFVGTPDGVKIAVAESPSRTTSILLLARQHLARFPCLSSSQQKLETRVAVIVESKSTKWLKENVNREAVRRTTLWLVSQADLLIASDEATPLIRVVLNAESSSAIACASMDELGRTIQKHVSLRWSTHSDHADLSGLKEEAHLPTSGSEYATAVEGASSSSGMSLDDDGDQEAGSYPPGVVVIPSSMFDNVNMLAQTISLTACEACFKLDNEKAERRVAELIEVFTPDISRTGGAEPVNDSAVQEQKRWFRDNFRRGHDEDSPSEGTLVSSLTELLAPSGELRDVVANGLASGTVANIQGSASKVGDTRQEESGTGAESRSILSTRVSAMTLAAMFDITDDNVWAAMRMSRVAGRPEIATPIRGIEHKLSTTVMSPEMQTMEMVSLPLTAKAQRQALDTIWMLGMLRERCLLARPDRGVDAALLHAKKVAEQLVTDSASHTALTALLLASATEDNQKQWPSPLDTGASPSSLGRPALSPNEPASIAEMIGLIDARGKSLMQLIGSHDTNEHYARMAVTLLGSYMPASRIMEVLRKLHEASVMHSVSPVHLLVSMAHDERLNNTLPGEWDLLLTAAQSSAEEGIER